MASNKKNPLESISQVNMDILPQLVGYNLRKAQLSSFRNFSQYAGRISRTTPAQLTILILVDANPGISQSLLGETMGMDRASTMAIIDKLERRHWLARHKSTVDRRKHALHLTPKGRTTLKKLREELIRHEQHITSSLQPDEKQQLVELLVKLI